LSKRWRPAAFRFFVATPRAVIGLDAPPDAAAHPPRRRCGAIGMHLAMKDCDRVLVRLSSMDEVRGSVATNGNGAVAHGAERPGDDHMGHVIRYLRQQLGMTQEEFAQQLGITVGTVSRWEKGRFRPSRLARALVVEFARAHNVPLSFERSPSRAANNG
jgi:DNA-binding XRE family transcriptional regulator